MHCLLRTINCILVLLLFQQLPAQEFTTSIEYLNVEQGLSNRFVKDIFQDSRGFMWISTNLGVNRYDGHSFQVFTKEKNRLQANNCKSILEDPLGNIWILYQGEHGQKDQMVNGMYRTSAIDVYNIKTGQIQPLAKQYPALSFLKNRRLSSIEIGLNRSIWISTYEGELYVFDGTLHLVHHTKNSTPAFTGIGMDSTFWIVQTNYIQEISNSGKILQTYPFPQIKECEIEISPDKKLWFTIQYQGLKGTECTQTYTYSAGDSLRIFKIKDKAGNSIPLQTETLHQVIHTANGNHWVLIREEKRHIFLYDDNGNLLYNLPEDIYLKENLKQFGYINDLYLSKDDILWITSDNGIIKIKLRPSFFRSYLDTLEHTSSRGIAPIDEHRVWVNTSGGWGIINIITGGKPDSAFFISDKPFQYNTQGYGAWYLDQSYLLIGTYGEHLYKVNLKDGNIIKEYTHPEMGRGGIIYQSKRSGTIWLSTESGLFYFDPVKDSIYQYIAPAASLFSKVTQRVNGFLENEEGIWLTTSEGLMLLDEEKGVKAFYKDFPHTILLDLHIDKTGIFWLATKGGGLLQWNRITNQIEQYTKENGLADNVLYAVYEDKLGYLWLPSNYGLMRFNKNTGEVNHYLPKDGLPHEEFNFTSHCQLPDGRLIFGGLNGIVVFRPEDLSEATYQAPLQLTNYQELSPATGAMLNKTNTFFQKGVIHLAHAIKSFYIEFALLDFSDVNTHRFAYQIENYDINWHYQKENYIRINKLPAGHYTLRIRGQGSQGLWSSQELMIPIIITKPFYQQIWFILALLLLLVSGIYLFILWRTANLRASEKRLTLEVQKRTRELKLLNATKDKLFSIIGHELRGPLINFQSVGENLNYLLQKEDWQRAVKMGNSISDSAKKVSHLLDNLLYWGLAQNQQLPYHPQLLSVELIIEEVCELFSGMAAQKEILIQKVISTPLQVYADERSLETILRNLVSNAIKFTPVGGIIQLSVQAFDDNRVQISVRDSGSGMTISQIDQLSQPINLSAKGTQGEKGTGLGLTLCRELVARNQGSMQIESQIPGGTVVHVYLPMSSSILINF